MGRTKKQRKRRAKLKAVLGNVKSKFGYSQGGVVHNSAKKLEESLDREKDYEKES